MLLTSNPWLQERTGKWGELTISLTFALEQAAASQQTHSQKQGMRR